MTSVTKVSWLYRRGHKKATCQTVYLCGEEAKFDNRALNDRVKSLTRR